jgi:hypothetical protein
MFSYFTSFRYNFSSRRLLAFGGLSTHHGLVIVVRLAMTWVSRILTLSLRMGVAVFLVGSLFALG